MFYARITLCIREPWRRNANGKAPGNVAWTRKGGSLHGFTMKNRGTSYLVGGLEHFPYKPDLVSWLKKYDVELFFLFFLYIGNFIIPTVTQSMIFQGGWRSTTKQIYHEIIGICSMDPRGCWNITVLCLKKGRPVGHLPHSYVKTFFRYESEIERGSRWWVSGWQVRFLNVPNLGDFIGFMGISLNLIMTSRRDITGMIVNV